ncbi:reverse transcriptase domain-containing protein [Flavonifractor plautii]|nr:reverse transcriptase domain-containing protein [Flavonifractor plautii]MDB7919060.1 reverse transcriptase domain-containing protein [Flavonifractor plautii]MDB7943130.1 reverse transcriptase domain-containing protein [Flavonifractor plautii]
MWRGLDWAQLEDELLEYQRSLARVAFAGHWGHVAELQKKLVRSLAAKALAVRHVVQNDSEPGIDGVRWQTDGEKMRAALSLTSKGYHARPYRRFLLQDGNKERRINVPTAYDKAMQALYAFSLDPVAESTADKKSFAFRKGRSIYDAHACLCRALEGTGAPEWIVRADVRACYDSLSQEWLLAHIPMDRKVLREFLKAGVAFGGELFPTEVGISQGASLSPILGNMALDGLQAYLYEQLYPNRSPDYGGGDLTRFADDMIITARSRAQAELILELLEQFLAARGLKLNWDKTYISKVSLGFEFLSRWYRREDSVLVVRPSDQAVKRFENSLESFILGHKGSQQTLIERLNRKLNGWGSYHRVTDAFDAFRRIDSCVQALLIKKMRQLHPKRKWKTIQNMYWYEQDGHHIFALRDNKSVRVARLAELEITEHKPIRLSFHPYLDQGYYLWLQRRRDDQKVSGAKRRGIWRRQAGRCHYCGRPMLPDQEIRLVELVLGRGRTVSNLAYIHQSCAYDVVIEGKEGDSSGLDVLTLLDGVTEPVRGLEDPYWDLREVFRLCRQPSVTLTFQEIERIIGFELDWEARYFQAFWFDEAPAYVGSQWEKEFPFHAVEPSRQAAEYVIADAWRSQGYRIQRLDLTHGKVVFHREVYGTVGLTIPPVLLQGRISENAAHEATTFFAYLIKKYGL